MPFQRNWFLVPHLGNFAQSKVLGKKSVSWEPMKGLSPVLPLFPIQSSLESETKHCLVKVLHSCHSAKNMYCTFHIIFSHIRRYTRMFHSMPHTLYIRYAFTVELCGWKTCPTHSTCFIYISTSQRWFLLVFIFQNKIGTMTLQKDKYERLTQEVGMASTAPDCKLQTDFSSSSHWHL